jgi:hypothetical protein
MTDRKTIEIRLLGLGDGEEVARLAGVDTAEAPASPLLGAIVDGRLLAAYSLATRASIADPFHRTDEIRSLLEERADQLRGRDQGLLRRLRGRFTGELGARSGARESSSWNIGAPDGSVWIEE